MEVELPQVTCHGPNVMRGYRKNPEATAEAFYEHEGKRFFRTGDMGRMVEGKFLKITGRIKEQFKLENGKYVVPAPMEDVFGRARQQALRLSTVLALAEHALAGNDGALPSIGADDVRRGIELMDRYFISMAERAIGYAGAPLASDALRLALYLRRLGKTTISVRDDIYRGPGSPVRKADAVAVALEELRQRGFIRDVARSSSIGRPGLLIDVHPDLING